MTPELWRPVGPFATGALFDDLVRVAGSGATEERDAALLAASASPDPRAGALLDGHPDVAARVADGTLTWSNPT